jgi:hypothetical protein
MMNNMSIKQLDNQKYLGFGNGSKKFVVSCEVRDLFTININADSEDEALEMANKLPHHLWNHPDVDEHLTHRVLVRMARWGNMSVKEIS